MKQTIAVIGILVLTAGCTTPNPTSPSDVAVEAMPLHEQLVVTTEEIEPGVWEDIGVMRVCDAPTSFFHNGQRIMQIVISADLPCPR